MEIPGEPLLESVWGPHHEQKSARNSEGLIFALQFYNPPLFFAGCRIPDFVIKQDKKFRDERPEIEFKFFVRSNDKFLHTGIIGKKLGQCDI
jgi:hypothetical protein